MTVNANRNILTVTPSDIPSSNFSTNSFIRFRFQKPKDTVYREFKDFYNINPLLTKALSDFERFNKFAEIFALVRWAADNNAIFLNKPQAPPFVKNPIVVKADSYSGVRLFETIDDVKLSYGYKD